MNMFSVIGMGPGDGRYILPAARDAINDADTLIGDERHTRAYQDKRALSPIGLGIRHTLDTIDAERQNGRVAVLVSGDPSLYSLHKAIARRFRPEDYILIPGLSSFQVLCARARLQWDDAALYSVHGRALSELAKVKPEKTAIIFTDAVNNAASVARELLCLSHVWKNRMCCVGERLGYDNEKIICAEMQALTDMDFSGLAVMVIPHRQTQ